MLRMVLVATLAIGLTKPVRATTFETDGRLLYAGIGIASAAVAITIVLIFHHKSSRIKATGGMELADEETSRSYVLSGDLAGVRDGNRITIEGRRHKEPPTFGIRKLDKDHGHCQP